MKEDGNSQSELDDRYTSNEEAQGTVRLIAAIIFCIGAVIAYFVWPNGVTDSTLAQITFGALLRAGAAFVIMLAALIMAGLLIHD